LVSEMVVTSWRIGVVTFDHHDCDANSTNVHDLGPHCGYLKIAKKDDGDCGQGSMV